MQILLLDHLSTHQWFKKEFDSCKSYYIFNCHLVWLIPDFSKTILFIFSYFFLCQSYIFFSSFSQGLVERFGAKKFTQITISLGLIACLLLFPSFLYNPVLLLFAFILNRNHQNRSNFNHFLFNPVTFLAFICCLHAIYSFNFLSLKPLLYLLFSLSSLPLHLFFSNSSSIWLLPVLPNDHFQ